MGMIHAVKTSIKLALNLRKFKISKKITKLSELATLIDIRNPFFTSKIKKLNKKSLELKKPAIFG